MRFRQTLMAGAALFAVATPGLHAQNANTQSEGEGEARRLSTVTVTAQKRAQDIQDVPISISAYDADFIEDSGVETLSDIALFSPNFTITSSAQKTNQRIIIRGVGSVGNAGIEPSVGVFIDGIYYPRPGSVIGNLIDLEAIEVLRGPQGTLFGRNTPVGALNIRTKDPATDEFEAYVEAGFGSFDAYELGGSVSGPINDRAAFRLSGKYTERGGYGTNLFNGEEFGEQDDLNLRAKLSVDLTPNLNLKLSADYGEINSGGATVAFLDGTERPQFVGTLNAVFGPGTGNVVTGDTFSQDIYQDHRDRLTDEQWGIAADLEWDLSSGHSIKSITSYREWEADNFILPFRLPAEIFPGNTAFTTETLSQEIQLLSPTGETFEYLAGVFFYDETYSIAANTDLGAQFCIPIVAAFAGVGAAGACAAGQQTDAYVALFDQDLQSIAAFGQGTWNASDNLSFTLGGRFTQDDKTGNFSGTVSNPFVAALRVRAPDVQTGLDISEYGDTEAFTYFANVSYDVSDDVMVFATTSTGFKSGGFNTQGTFPALTREQRGFSPEDTTNYELGIKSRLFDRTLQLNATLYRMDVEDFQDRAFDGISFLTRNVGELRQQGIETDFVWLPTDQLTVSGGLSYLDSEFLDYPNASALPGGGPQDLTGERNHNAPEWQGSLVVDWTDTLPSFDGMQYFLRGETQYVGEQNVGANTNQNPQSLQDAYQLFNLRAGLMAEDESWELSAWGRNLGDEGYCLSIFEQPLGGAFGGLDVANNTNAQRCVVGEPQTWGVQFKLRR